MRIGVTVPLAYGDVADRRAPTFAETLAFSRQAEQLELDSIWVYDHLIFRFPPEPEEGLHEAWTTLTALGATVPRVELGALVMCTSFRNAGLLAKMAATLDDLTGGRLILGIGCGWHEPEYKAFGYPFDHLVGRFEEDLEVIHGLLRGETMTREGRWSRYSEARLLPPPARVPPILVAAKGERMLRLTARWAEAWNTAWFGRVDETLLKRTADLDEACAPSGAIAPPSGARSGSGSMSRAKARTTRRAPTRTPRASPTCSTSSRRSAIADALDLVALEVVGGAGADRRGSQSHLARRR